LTSVLQKNQRFIIIYAKPFLWVSNYDNYNVGTIENKGIEIAANVIPVRTDDLEWSIEEM
jgi:iron complex outermembrane receptor protein